MITPPRSRLVPPPAPAGGGRGGAEHPARDLYSFEELWRHWRRCRSNKRSTANALRFEFSVEANLFALQQELREHTWKPGRSICFVTDGPKPREVFAADFRDRIVHHLLVSRLEPGFERQFIQDSFACRRGKGTLAASDRLMAFLRRSTANGKRRTYALKLDVASFFTSIDKARLATILERTVRDPELRWLSRTLLFHDPTEDYRFKPHGPRGKRSRARPGPDSEAYPVPAPKSLFGKENQRGLPIGNLTSQFWANVYLNELDQFVKRELKVGFYLRYVDDLVLLSEDPAQLEDWHKSIERFLRAELGLELRADKARPRLVSSGVDFVGWQTWWSHRLPRRRTLAALEARLRQFERIAVRPIEGGRVLRIDLETPAPPQAIQRRAASPATASKALHASLASYSGHLRHGAAWGSFERLFAARPWLEVFFERQGFAVVERFPLARIDAAQDFRRRYWEAIRRAGPRCLVFQKVGRFIEFRGPQRSVAEAVLQLRTARIRRGGYLYACGFPRHRAANFRTRALDAGVSVLDLVGWQQQRRLFVPAPATFS